MTIPDGATTRGAEPMQHLIRNRLGGRRGWLVGGAVLVAAGLAFGWNWLSAIGAAPILISLAPCLAMCALGLCMRRMTAAPGAAKNAAAAQLSGGGGISAAAPSGISKIDPPTRKELAK